MFCPKCGTRNEDSTKFCRSCGTLILQSPEEPKTSGPSARAEASGKEWLMQGIIGKKADYYMRKSSKMAARGTKISWNWAAFFFSMHWLIYRKLYLLGFALVAVNLVSSFLIGGILYLIVSFGIPLFLGFMGNYLYLQYVDNCYTSAAAMDTVSRDAYVAKNGGTNLPLVIVECVLLFAISFLRFL